MKDLIEKIKSVVRGSMYEVAKLLDFLTNGFIRPWHITILSLVGHVFVMLALTEGLFVDAAILLAGFGLMDALDGAIAKYQGSASNSGMLLDSSTDRLKEALIYAGLAYYFAEADDPISVIVSVVALGASFAVSYVKAKGEAALLEQEKQSKEKRTSDTNREFQSGVFGYEVRMVILFVALLADAPAIGVLLVASGALSTFIIRFGDISRRLDGKS